MEPNTQDIDMDAINEAIQRREQGGVPSQPAPQPQVPTPAPTGAGVPSMGMPTQGTGLATETKESSLIVKGLIERLKQFSTTPQ